MPGNAVTPPRLVTCSRWPEPWARMMGRAAWVTHTAPKKLVSIGARTSCSLSSSTMPKRQEVSGLSRGLVSYHFGSRQGLLEAVVGSIRDDFVTDLVTSPEAASMPGLQATVHLAGTYL